MGVRSAAVRPDGVRNVGWVVAASVIGFAGNEVVAGYRIRVGQRFGSAALVADGRHARAEGLTSFAVLAGALGAAAGWPLADPIVGLLITVAILSVLKAATVDVYRKLMDSVEPELVAGVHRVLSAAPGVYAADRVRVRWICHALYAEAAITCDAECSLAQPTP